MTVIACITGGCRGKGGYRRLYLYNQPKKAAVIVISRQNPNKKLVKNMVMTVRSI